MTEPGTTALAAILEFRLSVADEIATLQDSPNATGHANEVNKLKQLGQKLQDLEAEINDLTSRAHQRANELFQ